MKRAILITFLAFIFAVPIVGQTVQPSQTPLNDRELSSLKQKFFVEHAGLLSANLWTLTHDYKSLSEVNTVLNYLQGFFDALQSDNTAKLKEIGGTKGFKDKFLEFMKSEDGTVKGFAAIVLGIAGDRDYAPPIAALIKERDTSFNDRDAFPTVTYRGRAALALSLLGMKELAPEIALLLKSKNEYDRKGAISALGNLKASEYAKDVVGVMLSEEFDFVGDDSPIYFLIETGTAANFKKELVKVMLREFGRDDSKAAAYALVSLNSKPNLKEIASLLRNPFMKGEAAKALALLGAKEYANRIALLLNDKNLLVQKDAVIALGVLKAKAHARKVAKFLRATDTFVAYYAAISLVLMEASEYYREAIPIIEKTHRSGAYLDESDFHPIVSETARQLDAAFRELLEKAKSQIGTK